MKSVFYIVLKNRRKKGDSVRMEWPKIIQAPGYNIYHTLREKRVIIKVDTSGVIYEGSNHSSKYTMLKVPPLAACISFKIMNITLEDAGFYSVGTTDDDISLDRGVFLIVTGNHLNVANVMHEVSFKDNAIIAGFLNASAYCIQLTQRHL